MKLFALFVAISASLQGATAHYVFSHLLVNGTETEHFKFVRDVSKDPPYDNEPEGEEFGKTAPYLPDLSSKKAFALRCGRRSEKAAPKTETATLLAGDQVGFRIARHIKTAFSTINHPGPAQVYLHRTNDLKNDLGDGDWFKIAYRGPLNDTFWSTLVAPSIDVNFTIPKTTPPGTYLLRMEHFMPTRSKNYSQWYVSCAHVNIVGNGGGVPGPLVKIPEVYDAEDPGIYLQDGMESYNHLSKYVPPGPAIWKG